MMLAVVGMGPSTSRLHSTDSMFDSVRARIVEEYLQSYMLARRCDAVVLLRGQRGEILFNGTICNVLFCFD